MATVDHPTNLTEPADAGVAPADTRPRDAFAGFHEKTWCVLLHLSVLLCFAGGIGVIGPILMWQWSREQTDSTRADDQLGVHRNDRSCGDLRADVDPGCSRSLSACHSGSRHCCSERTLSDQCRSKS